MKTVVEVGWPLGLGLIMLGLVWYLVEDTIRTDSGRSTSSIGPGLVTLGLLCLMAMLFIPASYDPI